MGGILGGMGIIPGKVGHFNWLEYNKILIHRLPYTRSSGM
jgi:hypothetical protein